MSSENRGKKFRSKSTIDGLQPNQGWMFMECNACSWRAVEEGTAYRCIKGKCGSRHASLKFWIPVIASEDGASVDIVFFGDVARDLVGKPVDILIAENHRLLSTVPPEISGLMGRKFIVDVAVSRYSFRAADICFQGLKFCPEGSCVFAGFHATSLAANKAAGSMVSSAAGLVEQSSGSGSAYQTHGEERRPSLQR